MIFQSLGITGAILFFYGMISLVITQAGNAFVYSLLGLGAACLLSFVIFALDRVWQKIVGLVAAALASIGLVYYLFGYVENEAIRKYASTIILSYALLAFSLVGWIARNWLKVAFQNRSTRYGTSAAIYSLVVAFILIVVNIGSQDFNKQVDFTNEQINTLSDQTMKVLAQLKEPIKITAFIDSAAEMTQLKTAVRNLLDRYKAETKFIEYQITDADKDKALATEKHANDGDVVFDFGEISHITRDFSEQGFTQAILKVTRKDSPKLCFTTGHGEISIDASEETERSLSVLKNSLANQGFDPKSINFTSTAVPTECSVLIIASPTQRFPESEIPILEKYLNEGGKMIAMLDPIFPNTRIDQGVIKILPSGLEGLMKKWGVKLGNNLILEKHLAQYQGEIIEYNIRAINYGNHPIIDPLKGLMTFFDTVQSVQKADGFSGTTLELIKSFGQSKSWAETNIDYLLKKKKADPDGEDILGPVPFAMVVEKEGVKKTQMLVVGDGDFISNKLIQSYEYNYDFFVNTLHWMLGEGDKISIRPKKLKTSAIDLSDEQLMSIFYWTIVALPMVVLIFGINLWWYRRRRG